MTDYLDMTLSEQALNAVSNLGLAHIGDCVYELLVRTYLLCGGERTNRRLHAATVAYVSASAQAAAMEKLLPHLTEAESAVYRRGRNAHVHSVPKRADVADYHAATGLECLFGWLYLRGEHQRVNELFQIVIGGADNAT